MTLNADQALVPLTVFLLGSGFNQALGALAWGVATVTLLWRVRDLDVIGGVRFEPGRGRFWSGFGFGPGIIGGTGARDVKSAHVRQFS